MECHQFTLDLSGNTAIPSQYKIGLREICKWVSQQAKGHRDIQITNHYHRGCFSIQTGEKKTADFLRSFSLEINWHGKTYRVGLKPSMPDKPRIWVRFWGTCRGIMSQLANSFFDEMLEAAGFNILRPTAKRCHFDSDIFNGQRSALCQRGQDHVDREHEWIDEEGNVFKWRLEYDGQPHQCTRGCNTYHDDGKCATWERKKEQRSWGGQQKCFFVSSSMLRLAADTKTTRIDAIPGAKIGHVANHLNNDVAIFAQANIVAVHAGANMDLGSVEDSKPHVEHQARELVQTIKPLVDAEKKVFVVDPVAGPLVKEAPGGHHWAMVRQRMKKVAKEAKASWVSLQHVEWTPEEDIADDGIHYTKSGTTKVMAKIGEKIKEETGVDILQNMEMQEKPYEGVYRGHYKYGCYKCTRVHERGPCPPLPEPSLDNSDNDSPNSSVNSSLEGDASVIEAGTHNISTADSWAEDDDVTPTNASAATVASAPATTSGVNLESPGPGASSSLRGSRPRCNSGLDASATATAAIASYNEVAASGSKLLGNINNAKNRSTSGKRDRESAEDESSPATDKRNRTRDADKNSKGHVSRSAGGRGGRK